jgi:hypothetical protein
VKVGAVGVAFSPSSSAFQRLEAGLEHGGGPPVADLGDVNGHKSLAIVDALLG